jgi:UPF0716 protein FxsA
MPRLKWVLFAILLLPLAELAVFIAVAVKIGLPAALGLALATSLLGVVLLRLAGRGQRIAQIRVSMADGDPSAAGSSGFFLSVSGFLLLLPGFLTDALGLLMLLLPVQRALHAALGRVLRQPSGDRAGRDGVVDLEAGEWREEETARPPHDELPKPVEPPKP